MTSRGDGARHFLQLARRDDFGQHHGRRLQRFLFFLGIVPMGAVLDDQHADHDAAPQDRHAEEGMVDFFARLRQIFEGRMVLRIGEVESFRRRRDRADEAFADLQLRLVDRFRASGLRSRRVRAPGPAASHRSSTPRRPHWRRSARRSCRAASAPSPAPPSPRGAAGAGHAGQGRKRPSGGVLAHAGAAAFQRPLQFGGGEASPSWAQFAASSP